MASLSEISRLGYLRLSLCKSATYELRYLWQVGLM